MTLLIVLVLWFLVYFWPFIHALRHHKVDAAAIGMLNLFLGWTFLGWVVALVWAYKVDRYPAPQHTEHSIIPSTFGSR